MRNIKINYTLIILSIFVIPTFLYSCQKNNGQSEKNVLFILVDDLGWADLGCYGGLFYETPNIDKLSDKGVLFINAYASASVCSPTRASIMTGKYPARLHITDWIPGRQANRNAKIHRFEKLKPKPFQQFLPLKEKTIAEAMKEAGYQTFFAGKWHLGDKSKYWPEHQGFDTNIGGWGLGYPKSYFSPYKNDLIKDNKSGEYLTDRLTDETISFLNKRDKSRPFFAFLSFYAVHNPMQAKKSLVEKYVSKAKKMNLGNKEVFGIDKDWDEQEIQGWNLKLRKEQSNAEYAAMIETVDQNIGKLLQTVKDLGLDKNTLVIFTSDNGGLSTAEGSNTSNYPLRNGKGWLYEGGIRVPTIIYCPQTSRTVKINYVPIISMDFYPTILEYAGIDLIPEQHVDGNSILPLINGSGETNKLASRPLFWHYPHYSNQGPQIGSAVLKDGYKLIENFGTGNIELYNLFVDIGEKKDISTQNPSKVKELTLLLHQWRDSIGADMPVINPGYIYK